MTNPMDVKSFTEYISRNVPADWRPGTLTNVNAWLNAGKHAAIYADSRRSISDVANPACVLVSFGSSNSMLGNTSTPPTTLPDNNSYHLVGTYTGPPIPFDSIT